MAKVVKAITVDNDIWEQVKRIAKKENRPMSNFIETLLIKFLKEAQETKNPSQS